MNIQEIHKFFRGSPPPNAWEGEKMYGTSSSTPSGGLHKMKKKMKPLKKRKPKTPPTRYYA